MHKKTKGSIAEMMVASRLMEKGWKILFPFGENSRYDLVAEKEGKFVRVQVKYVTPKNGALDVGCKSSNNWTVDKYTADQIDFIAVYNSENKDVYFVPSSKFNSSSIKLRFAKTKNNQRIGVKNIEDFTFFK
jgi:Holliday junction resolvase-like predicted endonuclease